LMAVKAGAALQSTHSISTVHMAWVVSAAACC
jgi:hypothetical protein